jgi:hypothetical protein
LISCHDVLLQRIGFRAWGTGEWEFCIAASSL